MVVPAPSDLWEPTYEAMPRSDLRSLQGQRLAEQVAYVYERSWLFRQRMDDAGVSPADITGLDELSLIPTLDKEHMREARTQRGDVWGGALCVPSSQMAIVTHSTGTSGRPNFFGLTLEDLEQVGRIFSRSSYLVGIRPGDHVTIGASGHGAFVGWTKAFEMMGVVKCYLSGPNPSMVANLLDLAPDMDCIDALFVYQAERDLQVLKERSINPKEAFPQLRLLWSAVDASPARRRLLLEAFGVPLRNQYGSGDQFWMTGECPDHPYWMHVPDDMFVFEVLDPDTKQPVPPGEMGVLYVTNLFGRACPYLRYNMEDVVTSDDSPCSCGRTTTRLKVHGRLAWAVRTEARYVFSTDVEDILWAHAELGGADYQLIREARQPQHSLTVRVAAEGGGPLARQLEEAMTAALEVPATVELVGPAGIDRSSDRGKPARVVART